MIRIGKFTDFYRDVTKMGTKIPQEKYLRTGQYPVVDQGRQAIAGRWDSDDGIFEDVPAIVFGDHTRAIKYIEKPFFIGADGVKILRPANAQDSPKYLYYALQAARIPDLGYSRHFKAVKELEIRIYSREEQDEIVRVLEKIDHLIEQRHEEVSCLEQLVKSRFIELFGDPEFNTMNWPIAKLSTICDVGSSKRIYQSELKNDGVPFLRISDLNERIDGEVNTPQLFIPMEKFDELKANGLVPVSGDILVTSRGTLGRCYIVKDGDNFYFQDGMISWLSGIDQRILNLFLSHLFSTTGVQKQIMNLQAGSTVAYLSIAMLKQLDIILPPMELQEQFAAFVEQTDKSKLAIQASLDKLEILKKSLMQQYFG